MIGNANTPTVAVGRQTAMPEWITRKDDEGGAWTVQEGQPVRGDAWTNITMRQMRVPMGNDETSRLVRAHELTHTKVSPRLIALDGRYGASQRSIEVCEEARVNWLVKQAGFDVNHLVDGSEQRTGEIAGENNAWNEAVQMLMACAGTKGADLIVKGVKKTNPEMSVALNEAHKAIKKELRRMAKSGSRRVASTAPDTMFGDEQMHPHGFRYTVALARFLDRLLVHDNEDGEPLPGEDDGANVPDAEEVKDRANTHGQFPVSAKLVEKVLPKPRKVTGTIGRKRIASQTGVNPRHMTRLLTDPDRRVFDRKIRGNGGIVLIDQSNSMRLTEKDLWAIIESAPGCMIIGYSHKPGTVDVPNVWILADRGKVVDEIPTDTAGNGVDVPALRFALRRRKGNEPVVWICDGVVTDKDDHVSPALAEECAKLVLRFGVHQVPNVSEGVTALKRAGRGQKLHAQAVGHVARTRAWQRRNAT